MAGRSATPIAGYSLWFSSNVNVAGANPADGATIILGASYNQTLTTNNIVQSQIPLRGVLTDVELSEAHTTTNGSSEALTVELLVNNVVKATVSSSLALNQGLNTRTRAHKANLNVPVVPGDNIEIKITCPTWATNPQGVLWGGSAFIRTT